MVSKIKICGLSTPQAIDASIEAGADYAGLVFFAASPRNVSLGTAARLAERSAGQIARVGLFVDADDATIAAAVAAGRLSALQLHGEETPERVARLKALSGLPVWKALPVSTAADIDAAGRFAGAADLVLFDARTPQGSALPGGMGLSFDWSLLAGWKPPMPWGLAGGLTPASVGDAVRITGAPLVDTSSGVESAPGAKDVDKIRAFCKAARTHDKS